MPSASAAVVSDAYFGRDGRKSRPAQAGNLIEHAPDAIGRYKQILDNGFAFRESSR
jgi:hypothetical protein